MTVFWGTNLFIYLIERHPTFPPRVRALYQEQRGRGDRLVTSALTLGELLAEPLRHGRPDLARQYTALMTSGAGVELVVFDRKAAEHYARIRAETAVRQPDAMQLACAAACGAGAFITNDQRLWRLSVRGVDAIRGL